MLPNFSVVLSSDAFLSCLLLVLLSMIGLRLMPFNLSNLKTASLRGIWREITLGSSSQSQLERAISAFYHYEQLSLLDIKQMRKSYAKIGRAYKRIGYELAYPAKLDNLAELTKKNALVTSAIAKMALDDIEFDHVSDLQSASSSDLREVREALRHFVRDWSNEAAEERTTVMRPILDVFEKIAVERRKSLKVLVPGCGLGRLAWEISELGFDVNANELSPFMNICFRFLLDPKSTRALQQYTLHPFAHWFSHQRTNSNLFRPVSFPDALPRLSSTFHHMSGDFLLLGPRESYDFIVAQFFIDTSYNIISTLEQIHRLLRPGGTWINLGPLLWRNGAQAALELSLDEVLALSEKIGFEVDEGDRKTLDCEYTADREAMMRWVYKAEFWVARKRTT